MYNSNAILSYGWMHLTTSTTHSSRIINPITCGFLFAVNINQVTALGRKCRLKEGRKEDRHALITYRLFARESHCDSFNLKSWFLARCFRRWNVIFSLVWSEISFLRCSTVR